ncbi:T-complex protein 1 subunit gamma, partial [Caligus rogercresseyi]
LRQAKKRTGESMESLRACRYERPWYLGASDHRHETTSILLLRIDDIVSGSKSKSQQNAGAAAPTQEA